MILRFGLGAESLAWLAIFLMAPVSAIYYPVSVLPGWLQWVAWALPSAHIFEGMRAILFDHTVRTDLMVNALALNALYIALGVAVFLLLRPRRPQARPAAADGGVNLGIMLRPPGAIS